jgi:hypothetical protein
MQRIQAHQLPAMPSDADEAVERWAAQQPPSRTASWFSIHLNRSPHLAILPSCHLTLSLISYSTPESCAAQLLTARQGKMQEARSRSIEHLSGLGRTFCGVRNPAASFLTSTFQTFVTIHLLSFSAHFHIWSRKLFPSPVWPFLSVFTCFISFSFFA